jgi:hypothetical protein
MTAAEPLKVHKEQLINRTHKLMQIRKTEKLFHA